LTIALPVALAAGCGKEKVTTIDPQTKMDLDQCLKDKAEKDKLNASLLDDKARLERDKPKADEIVVSIEGTALTVKPGKAGAYRPIDDKAAGAASKEFLDVVAKSRGAIQKCYEQALKKDTGLQARTVTLTVSASFGSSGSFVNSSFAPSLNDVFDKCMQTIASKWVLPQNSPAMSFKAQVELKPS
jgi:hypothetical protein